MSRPQNELHTQFKVHVGLVHWPVLDRLGNTVCTNITNFDIMDIARVSRSLGVESYTLINRVRDQLMFTERIIDHWKTGYGTKYNPTRASALGMVKTAETLEECIKSISPKPLVVVTAARDLSQLEELSFRGLRETNARRSKATRSASIRNWVWPA
ncbi:MAG: RNA methyltransferase [Bdellovibrionales bacterium]